MPVTHTVKSDAVALREHREENRSDGLDRGYQVCVSGDYDRMVVSVRERQLKKLERYVDVGLLLLEARIFAVAQRAVFVLPLEFSVGRWSRLPAAAPRM
jgi:hypothetical protein